VLFRSGEEFDRATKGLDTLDHEQIFEAGICPWCHDGGAVEIVTMEEGTQEAGIAYQCHACGRVSTNTLTNEAEPLVPTWKRVLVPSESGLFVLVTAEDNRLILHNVTIQGSQVSPYSPFVGRWYKQTF
jgi:Fe-S cluster biogenesis protein NfuA